MSDKKQDFNGGYIEASQEAYDLLISAGYKNDYDFNKVEACEVTIFNMQLLNKRFTQNDYIARTKQFYINNGELSWRKPSEPKTNNDNTNSGVFDSESDVVSVEDGDGKVYEFEKPSFECELLKMVTESYIVGYVQKEIIPLGWGLNGWAYDSFGNYLKDYNLTPIKFKWYKDESLLSKGVYLIKKDGTGLIYVVNNYKYTEHNNTHWLRLKEYGECAYSLSLRSYRLATKEEVDSLFYNGKGE